MKLVKLMTWTKWMKWMKWMTWINEWLNEWLIDWLIDWLADWRTDWLEWVSEWVGGWMSGCATSLLSYFFTVWPLRWGTSSLSYFWSEQPVIWATSSLARFCSALPACPSLLLLLQPNSSSRGQNGAFCNIQLQSSVAASALLSSAQSCRCVSSQVVANLHNFDAPSNRFRTWNYWRANKSGPSLPTSVFSIFWWKQALATVSCAFCRPHVPKVTRDCSPEHSGSRYIQSPAFFSQMEARNRNRPYFRDPTIPFKDTRFRARKFLHPRLHTLLNCYTLLYNSQLRTAIAASVVDMMTRLTMDIRPQVGFFWVTFPLIIHR